MPTIVTTTSVDADGLANLRRARTDVVIESPGREPGTWAMTEGPFLDYRRSLTAGPVTDGRYQVTERTEFTLATGVWSPLINPLMRRVLASTDRRPRLRWWWPREIVTLRTAQLVTTLTVLSVLAGYLGVVIGQTITFAAADFDSSDSAQAYTLAATRIGVLISLLLVHRADRIGRRPLILAMAAAAIGFTLLGALSPNLVVLGATQTVARGLTTGLATLVLLATTEEVPAGNRAFAISLIAICAALGGGPVLWVLPVADLVSGGWRVVYVVPVLFLPVLWWVARQLPETRRFDAATEHQAPAPIDWRRFALLGCASFVALLFISPASQLRNEYLRGDLGFSATGVSVFQLVIALPAGAAVVAAGVMADRMGRRWVAAIGLGAGSLLAAASYQLVGPVLWLVASGGVVLTGAFVPAIGGYKTELFPTRARARVGALFDVVGVAGSATGLVVVGQVTARWLDLGTSIGVMVIAPLLVAILILTRFPETASVELETLNPDDPALEKPSAPGGPAPDAVDSPRAMRGAGP